MGEYIPVPPLLCIRKTHIIIDRYKMPKLVLHYFDFPFWRAEVCRLSLHLGKVEFEDKKIKDFKEFKESGIAPFGQAPILEVDGKVIAQTGAIARYCGKLGGFYPKNDDFAAAKIDEIIDTATDITNHVGKTMFIKDDKEKLAARAELCSGKLAKYLEALEKFLTQNGSTGFYVGNQMTIADLAVWRLMGWLNGGVLDGIPKTVLEPYKQVDAHFKSIEENPQIRAYMKEKYNK